MRLLEVQAHLAKGCANKKVSFLHENFTLQKAFTQKMENIIKRPVRTLSVDVARKIAAGEVIDRPAAIIRELMDNAVDSGANIITVEISGGGIEKIRIADNGYGMTKDDLQNCARPHATSKIVDAADLMNLTTLGFRGEALASIAAVAKLTISSGTFRMTASIDSDHTIEQIPIVQNGRGTIVQSENLFENFPARRLFLKRPASETNLCREIFLEKTLPRTDIAFRLIVDGSLRFDLPANVSLAERFVRALELKQSSKLFSELKNEGFESDGKTKWSFKLIIGEPSIYRNDRKNIYIYVNGRRVQEYSLIQAIEYGCQGFFPNGVHPIAALFVQVNPKMVDFNIHPAKKEVRFKDISALHHGVSTTTKTFFRSYGIKNTFEDEENKNELNQREFNFSDFEKNYRTTSQPTSQTEIQKTYEKDFRDAIHKSYAEQTLNVAETRFSPNPDFLKEDENQKNKLISRFREYETNPYKDNLSHNSSDYKITHPAANLAALALTNTENNSNAPDIKTDSEGFRYIGTVLGTFLLAEVKNTLYIIDLHAAHERILFNELMKSGNEQQDLLIPYEFELESKEADTYLQTIKDVLNAKGFGFKKQYSGKWRLKSILVCGKNSIEDLKKAIFEDKVPPEEIIYQIAAMTACKAAVKDGSILDKSTAAELAKKALNLPDPHCPHGRPVWTTLTKEQLFARVRRT